MIDKIFRALKKGGAAVVLYLDSAKLVQLFKANRTNAMTVSCSGMSKVASSNTKSTGIVATRIATGIVEQPPPMQLLSPSDFVTTKRQETTNITAGRS